MARAVAIRSEEMASVLEPLGFKTIYVEGVREQVFAKRVAKNISVRVYTSVCDGVSRGTGKDAIRVTAFAWIDGGPKMIGGSTRVHRVTGWRENLQKRLRDWQHLVGPICPECGGPTVLRRPKQKKAWRPFYGCANYPTCRGLVHA